MQRFLLFALLLLLLPLYPVLSQSYEITEIQLTKLETTIKNQKISIDKQAILLESSKQQITQLESLTATSEKIIKQQEILLQKSENKSWIDSLKSFLYGLLTGGLLTIILTYTGV